MKRLLAVAMFLLALPCFAQLNQPTFQYTNVIPNGTCTGTPPIQIMYLTGIAYSCNNGTWGNFAGGGGGGGTPTGPAGGVLSGFFPNPSGFSANAFDSPPPIGNVTPNTGAFSGITISGAGPGVIQPTAFSASGTPLPTCNLAAVNSEAVVSDATAPTSMGAYVSGGAVTAAVICSYNGTSYAWLTVGGATGNLPGGSGLVKVTGGTGGLATAGVDYALPNANTTGTAANLSGTPTLPTGTAATTGTVGENDNLLATNAQVYASKNAAIPVTSLPLCGNAIAGQSKACTAGTDYFPPVSAPGAGYAVVSTAAGGGSYSDQAVALGYPAGLQYIQQPLNNGFLTALAVNSLNNIFYVDGFNSYAGVGSAVVAFNPGINRAECQVVSYSGSYYIAVSGINNTTTPGTFSPVWYPVPNNAAATNVDCAWYMAESFKQQNHRSYMIAFGAGHYTVNQSLIDYIDNSGFDDQFSVSAYGCGPTCTYLTYAGTAGLPVFTRAQSSGNTSSMQFHDMTIDGGGLASAVIQMGSIGQAGGYFYNLNLGHVAPGSDHVLELGLTTSDSNQVNADGITIDVYPDSGVQNCGIFTASGTGTTVTPAITSGGACYSSAYTGLTVARLLGTQNGTSNQPCATMPTGGGVVTITGSAVSAITPFTGATGCVGPYDVQVYQIPNVNYGAILNASDSTYKDIISYVGSVAAFNVAGGDNAFIHLHPAVVPNGIIDSTAGGHFSNTELDAIGGYGFQITQPFANNGTTISQTHTYIGGRLLPGSATFNLRTAPTVLRPVVIAATGPLCVANSGGGAPTHWQEFITPSGPIVNPGDYTSKAPAGLSVIGNDTSCGQAMGDYVPTLTTGAITSPSITTPSLSVTNITNAPTVSGLATFTAGIYTEIGPTVLGIFGGTLALQLGSSVAAAATIAPLTMVTHVTGTAATVQTITEPSGCRPSTSQVCEIRLISDAGFAMGTSGNIASALTTTTGRMYVLDFDANTSKWYPTD